MFSEQGTEKVTLTSQDVGELGVDEVCPVTDKVTLTLVSTDAGPVWLDENGRAWKKQGAQRPEGPTTMELIKIVLREHGPLSVKDIVGKMRERGWQTRSKQPDKVVISLITHSELGVIKRAARGLYTIDKATSN